MPDTRVEENRCGAKFPGYIGGTHPRNAGEILNAKVCFSLLHRWDKRWTCNNMLEDILIANCGEYYTYFLVDRSCTGRYCSV